VTDVDPVRAALADNVRRLAEARGLSLYVLADFAGLSRAYLYAILRGEKSPTITTVAKLASALDVPAWQLLKPVE